MNTEAQRDINPEQIEMGKLFAEMMNLMADTRKMQAETQKMQDEREKLRAETQRQIDEREKIRAETTKMQTETRWHPLFIVAGAFTAGAVFLGAVVAAVKALFF